MKSHISGIPCTIEYSIYGSYLPAKTNAPPEHCYEAEYPEIEFIVCDRRGYPAPWLARKMSENDQLRIEAEILESL